MNAFQEPSEDEFSFLIKLYSENRLRELIVSCGSMIEKLQYSPKLHNIMGAAHTGLKQFDAAINCYETALKINPNYAEAHNNMGNTFKIKGEFDNAIQCFKKALFLKPNYAEAYNNMGVSNQSVGEYKLAISQFEKAIDLKNDYVDAFINKGSALKFLGDIVASVQTFKEALKIDPGSYDAYFFMGLSLRHNGSFEEAIKCFEKTIKIKPDHFDSYNYLGNSLKSIGQTKKAIHVFEKALTLKEDLFEIHRHLAFAKEYNGSESQIEKLLDLRDQPDLSDVDHINISFTLGKIYEDLEKFDHSFRFIAEGNRLRKKELHYAIEDDIELFNSIKNRFKNKDEEQLVQNKIYDIKKITPIFIVGMPRSGTTLIEQIVSSHSKVHGAGELNFLGKGVEINNLVNKDFTDDTLHKLRTFYFNQLEDLTFKESFVTDKMPLNFRWCGFILKAIPEAKIIHVSRDRMATCFSLFKSYFSSTGNRYAYDLKDIDAYYNLYLNLMKFWKLRFPRNIHEINYETLTEAPEKEIRKLITVIGLEWEDSCLDFHKNKRPVMTLSKSQVREKLYQGSSQQWKNYEPYLNEFNLINFNRR